MSIMDRIRAHGGEIIRDEWRVSLRKGRLSQGALLWLREHKADLIREVWPEYDEWTERAAIMEFDGGMARANAEAIAYRRVMGC